MTSCRAAELVDLYRGEGNRSIAVVHLQRGHDVDEMTPCLDQHGDAPRPGSSLGQRARSPLLRDRADLLRLFL